MYPEAWIKQQNSAIKMHELLIMTLFDVKTLKPASAAVRLYSDSKKRGGNEGEKEEMKGAGRRRGNKSSLLPPRF